MHIPVLLQEVVEGLDPKHGDIILDATVGGGGHSEAICKKVNDARFICIDADEDAILRSRARLSGIGCQFDFYEGYFRNLDKALSLYGVSKVNRVIFDLGLSSYQLEESGRGFTFLKDEPLQMTFGKAREGELTAQIIVNNWGEESIAAIIKGYGEERNASRIAKEIVRARKISPINSTGELRKIIEKAVKRRGKINPATKTFQALRMAVNDEFLGLKEGLSKAWESLAKGGRIAVISFHSIEDRTVKDYFRSLTRSGQGRLISKKPLVPAREETISNPRSRSAKLRIIEKFN